jgi:TonB family protein
VSETHELFARASVWLWPALANHLWQATVFAALVFAVMPLLPRAPARATRCGSPPPRSSSCRRRSSPSSPGAQGTVSVRITVDEDGNVVSAEAVSGHPLLRSAAVEAAHAAKFKPTLLEGKPVKVAGVISYTFVLSGKDEEDPEN